MFLFFVSIATVLLISISAIHIYWAFGGTRGSSVVVPIKKETNEPLFKPQKYGTLFVAFLLLFAAFLLLVEVDLINSFQDNYFLHILSYSAAIIFFIRAIGDFRFVGFFKKVKHSTFAKYDTRFYSPLCLFLSFVFIIACQNL